MTFRRDNIEEAIRLVQERIDAHQVKRVTDLPEHAKEELVKALAALLDRQK
ncbi:MAG: hypothetical protein NZ518_05785 [Dehalococcoidia bacterium]|nr:hypothetical protein [Dehalococcoidia bacterium]